MWRLFACKIWGLKEASIGEKHFNFTASCHSQNCSKSVVIKSPSKIALWNKMLKIKKKKIIRRGVRPNDYNWLHMKGGITKSTKVITSYLNSPSGQLSNFFEFNWNLKYIHADILILRHMQFKRLWWENPVLKTVQKCFFKCISNVERKPETKPWQFFPYHKHNVVSFGATYFWKTIQFISVQILSE